MRTIAIRDIRAEALRRAAADKTLLGVTDSRVVIGVFCPIGQNWLLDMATHNSAALANAVAAGEQELRGTEALPTLEELRDPDSPPAQPQPLAAAAPLVEAFAAVSGTPEAGPVGQQLVGIGQLSAARLREAAADGQLLVVTDRRELIGIVVPVNQQLLAHLVAQNLPLLRRSVERGEAEYQSLVADTVSTAFGNAAMM